MSSPVDVEVRLRLKDSATVGIKSISKVAQEESAKTLSATEKAAQRAADATEKGLAKQRDSHGRFMRYREELGVRSERVVQQEIQRTEEAYKKLKASGTLSWHEQAAAADKMRQKITQLTNEMGKLTTAQKVASGLKFTVSGIAGTAAAAYTLKQPIMNAMSFDERLAHMANTAFSERDASGRKIGMQSLEAAINKSVGKGGGGTREQAAEALDSLISSGVVGSQDAMAMLPQLMKFSSASGADASQLAQIGIRAMQTFKVSAADMPNIMNMAIAAGQAGGFELKDMARWLPQQMAAATQSGMSGKAGFAKLAALNQASAITAGTKDEAGNNVVNLLGKINSSDTATEAKKLGIDLPKYLQKQREKGVDSIDAFAALVDKTVSSRSDYKALQSKLKSATNNDEKKATLESMATIAQGAGIGKLVQDRQAMMALLAMMNNRDYMADVLKKVSANDVAVGGAGDKNYELIAGTGAFQLRQAEQQKDIGQKAALDSLTPAIAKAAEAFSDLAAKHPLLVGAATLSTAALSALAGAAGIASMAMGGKGVIGGAALGQAGAWVTASKLGGGLSKFAKAGTGIGLASVAGGYALDTAFGEDSAISRYGSSAMSGMALGATLGSVVPVVGTGAGAVAGGMIGFLIEKLRSSTEAAKKTEEKTQEQKPVEVTARLQIGLSPNLVVQSQNMQVTGGNARINTGNVVTGAPG